MKNVRILLILLFCCTPLLAMGVSKTSVAQTKTEICDNKVDDDGDGLVDCDDPDCTCKPPVKGTPCSPGYWKNHRAVFEQYCGSVPGWTCDELWTALTCRGSDASCRRQAAAAALNAVSGCTED